MFSGTESVRVFQGEPADCYRALRTREPYQTLPPEASGTVSSSELAAELGWTQCEEQPCSWLYEALYLKINLPVVLLTPSDYAAVPVK